MQFSLFTFDILNAVVWIRNLSRNVFLLILGDNINSSRGQTKYAIIYNLKYFITILISVFLHKKNTRSRTFLQK
jgi:hypothetical protein